MKDSCFLRTKIDDVSEVTCSGDFNFDSFQTISNDDLARI
jgi:hypothetical protein